MLGRETEREYPSRETRRKEGGGESRPMEGSYQVGKEGWKKVGKGRRKEVFMNKERGEKGRTEARFLVSRKNKEVG